MKNDQILQKAIDYIQESNKSLKECATYKSEGHLQWDNEDTKQEYKEIKKLIKKLKKIQNKQNDNNKFKFLIELIFDENNHYNGHSQIEINSMNIQDVKDLMKELDKYCKNYCSLSINSSNNENEYEGSIDSIDEWEKNEHPLGHTKQLLLSINKINF